MMLTPRAITLVGCAIASLGMLGCDAPCNDGDRCGDDAMFEPPARALQTPGKNADASSASPPASPTPAASSAGVTFSVEGTTGAKLVIAGAKCAGDRCTFASVPTGEVRVDLTLASHGTKDMPVWVRWRGCTPTGGQLWPVWDGGPSPEYTTLYTHAFSGLSAGSQCVAEVAQGSWYIFAGNLSVKATTNAQYCREQYSSPENLNLHCFVPAKEKVALTSSLIAWDCYGDARSTTPTTHRTGSLSFTAAGNEVISCIGRAR